MTLEGEVHQCRAYDIVLMVAEGYLVATEFLGEVEDDAAAHGGTDEADRLGATMIIAGEADLTNVEGDTEAVGEVLEILRVGHVVHLPHAHMDGLDAYRRHMDALAAAKEFEQRERVLASGYGHEDVVAVLEKVETAAGVGDAGGYLFEVV